MGGFFITGTNTGVGKTVITRALARALSKRGRRVAALKPEESGADPTPLDAVALARAARMSSDLGENIRFTFRDPVSPHLAALREGQTIRREEILSFVAAWEARGDLLLVEGAGGLLVPLANTWTYGDLVPDTGLRLIIVAPNVLGAINVTLLTLEAARHRHIDVAGVILNGTPSSDFGNASAISRIGAVPVLGEFPTAERWTDDEELAALATATLQLDIF